MMASFEMHSHHRGTAGYGKDGKWHEATFSHSHEGGSEPHRHADTGPSFYSYWGGKKTARPNSEQMQAIPLTEEESTFKLVITDSAILNGDPTKPIGNTPLEIIGMPAADRLMKESRLKCILIDARKGGAR